MNYTRKLIITIVAVGSVRVGLHATYPAAQVCTVMMAKAAESNRECATCFARLAV